MDCEDDLKHNEDIEKYLNLNLKLISCIGFDIHPSGDAIIKSTKFLKKIPASLVIFFELYGAICQSMFIVEAINVNDYFLMTQVTCQIFTNILCVSKGIGLITAIEELTKVLHELAMVWREYVYCHENREEIREKARNTLRFCKIFVAVTFSAVMSYGLPTLQNVILIWTHRNAANYTCNYGMRVFFMKYPFAINDPMTYLFIALEEEYLLMGAALFWICADTFFAQLTMHASMQFEMLRNDFDLLINVQTSDVILKQNFVKLIVRHKRLLRICERIEKIYSPIVLVAVLISSINICFNMFELSEAMSSGRFVDASSSGFVLINTFLQIFFYCVFAETLTNEVSSVADAIYNTKWIDNNYKFGAYVQMFIIRSQKPFYCTAYGFFPIGHTRLTMVLKTAFSYYMMLRATT